MKKIKAILLTAILSLASLAGIVTVFKTVTNIKADASIIPSGQVLDTIVDTISVSDLTISGKTNQDVVKDNADTGASFRFNEENINKNLIFKFKYDVVDTNPADSNAMRVHFDVADSQWNEDNALWLRGDGTYLKYHNGSKFTYQSFPALSAGMHEIEFGRIALLNENDGSLINNFYVYFNVDGVKKGEHINPYDVSKMDGTMFLNFSAANTSNKLYDTRYVAGPYEIPDRISVSDLQSGGASIGKELTLSAHKTFSYNSYAEHKSVVFNFLYEVKNRETIGCQFHFSNTWLGDSHGGIVWFRDDKNRISKAGGGYLETSPFNAVGVYEIEIKKLYIVSGEDTGKYYLSLSVNGLQVLEYTIADMPDKANLFTTGTNGDMLYDISYMPVNLSTDLYLYKWNVSSSGLKFIGQLRKDVVDIQDVSKVGFIIAPVDDYQNKTKVVCKLVEDGSYYRVSAAITALDLANITRQYKAKLYYTMPNSSGIEKTYYSKEIATSFYAELDDLSGLSEANRTTLESVKANVLNVSLNEDSCAVEGATKTGDFASSSIVLEGANPAYTSYVVNGDVVTTNDLIKIGYRTYKVSIDANVITLTKQAKTIMYGGSEHFVEINSGHDSNMTAANLSPMATNLGLSTMRFDIDFNDLFNVLSNNELTINYAHVAKIQGIIDELKTNGGINDFLAVFWVVQPYGFKDWDGKPWSGKTCPNPSTQAALYQTWLEMNGKAARIAAELFPDVHNFETWNEAEIMSEEDGPLAKPNGTNYSVTEKAKILTDLMHYYNKGIKEANPKNMLSTPSLCCSQQTDSEFDVTSPNFLKALYQAITDATPVTGYAQVDTNPNNYFQAINIHPYLARGTTTSNWKTFVQSFHTQAENYGDSGTEIWVTEFGFAQNRESNCQSKMLTVLARANEIEYLTKFYFYKIHDYTDKIDEDRWGLYNNDCTIKAIGTAVKNYINN